MLFFLVFLFFEVNYDASILLGSEGVKYHVSHLKLGKKFQKNLSSSVVSMSLGLPSIILPYWSFVVCDQSMTMTNPIKCYPQKPIQVSHLKYQTSTQIHYIICHLSHF